MAMGCKMLIATIATAMDIPKITHTNAWFVAECGKASAINVGEMDSWTTMKRPEKIQHAIIAMEKVTSSVGIVTVLQK